MDDNDFDVLVRRAGAAPVAGEATLAALVAATRSHAHGRRRPGRRALVLGGLAAGSLLLAAGASTSVLMHRAPFQSAEVGVYRTRA